MADDLLQRGSRMIERVRAQSLAHAVIYVRREGEVQIELNATVDTINTDLLNESQLSMVDRMRDFLLSRSDLAHESIAFLPSVGDEIRETINGETTTYELVNTEAEPCYVFDDQLNMRIRVHTRRSNPSEPD